MRPGVAPPLAANAQARLLGVEDAGRAARAEVQDEGLRHLARHLLLQDEPVGEAVDEAGQLSEPDHPLPRG